jgi:hypothetical protein
MVRQGSLPGPDRKKFAPNGRVAPNQRGQGCPYPLSRAFSHGQDPERSSFIIPKLRDLGGMDRCTHATPGRKSWSCCPDRILLDEKLLDLCAFLNLRV